jgi:hypothetical protein
VQPHIPADPEPSSRAAREPGYTSQRQLAVTDVDAGRDGVAQCVRAVVPDQICTALISQSLVCDYLAHQTSGLASVQPQDLASCSFRTISAPELEQLLPYKARWRDRPSRSKTSFMHVKYAHTLPRAYAVVYFLRIPACLDPEKCHNVVHINHYLHGVTSLTTALLHPW